MCRVLLVGDDVGVTDPLLRILSGDGHGIVHVRMLAEAISTLQRKVIRPDVILLDLDLPDSDGVATGIAISRHCGNIPLVVLADTDEDWSLIKKLTRNIFVRSDIDFGRLKTVVNEIVGGGEAGVPQESEYGESEVTSMVARIRDVMAEG